MARKKVKVIEMAAMGVVMTRNHQWLWIAASWAFALPVAKQRYEIGHVSDRCTPGPDGCKDHMEKFYVNIIFCEKVARVTQQILH